MNEKTVLTRRAEAARRLELGEIDDRLCNVRALFAITTLTALASFAFSMLRDSTLLAALGVLSFLGLCWCLVTQYRLVQTRDRLARSLSWIGVDGASAPPGTQHGPQQSTELTASGKLVASTKLGTSSKLNTDNVPART
jgi:hypothetical protein